MNIELFVQLAGQEKASAILRCNDTEKAALAMEAAIRGGFRTIEFTLTIPDVYDLVRDFSKREGLVVGTGTVMEEEQAIYKDIMKDDPGALVIIDAALLIESENYRQVDKVFVIACDIEIQIRRIMAKNTFSREDAQRRLQQQMPLEEKVKFADYVLHNDSGLSELEEKVEALFHQVKQWAV